MKLHLRIGIFSEVGLPKTNTPEAEAQSSPQCESGLVAFPRLWLWALLIIFPHLSFSEEMI